MAQRLHPKYKVTHPIKALQLLRFTSIPGQHHGRSSQLPRTRKPLLHSQPANTGGGRALGRRTNPRVLPPFWWHDPADWRRDWWKMQCRKSIRSWYRHLWPGSLSFAKARRSCEVANSICGHVQRPWLVEAFQTFWRSFEVTAPTCPAHRSQGKKSL